MSSPISSPTDLSVLTSQITAIQIELNGKVDADKLNELIVQIESMRSTIEQVLHKRTDLVQVAINGTESHSVELKPAGKNNIFANFARNYGSLGPWVGAVVSFLALFFAFWTISITIQNNTMSNNRLHLATSQQNAAKVYDFATSLSKYTMDHPEIYEYVADVLNYFDAKIPSKIQLEMDRPMAERSREWSEQRETAKKKLEQACEVTRNRVWIYTEYLADYMDYAYIHRLHFTEEDWAGWWNYFCTEYDRNAYLREYMKYRGEGQKWYTVYPILELSDAEKREEYRKITNKRRLYRDGKITIEEALSRGEK